MGGGTDTGMTTAGGSSIINDLGYDPSQVQGGGFDYAVLGQALSKGLGQYGSALSSGANHNYMTNTPNLPQSTISAASPQTNVIPGSGMLGASVPYQNSGSMEALMRLLQGMYS